MDIGRAIYALRKEKGLKLEEVALDAGTDSGHLSRVETGSRNPSLLMLEKIAVAMGVRVSLIVAMAEGEGTTNAAGHISNMSEADLSEESIQLRQHFRTLTSKNQLALLEIAKVLNRLQRNS
ncbi:MAG: helix-turn-helix transcriptional regulator [Candidatus Nanopelagicaceae bacterium]|nr:helix-turn-helix transcriptional regulator [Candidatus Nanopelagicaceae bacterium]